jgi:hypothetical protein
MAGNGRVIVGCQHGDENPDSVAVAYLTAGAALDQGKDVVMWLTSDGVRLGRHRAEGIRGSLELGSVHGHHGSTAEGEGFEPSSRLRGQRFSRPSHSTALPPLLAATHSHACRGL